MEKAIAKKIEADPPLEPDPPRPCRGPQELSRLELDCMRAIWLGNALTVHDVQKFLGSSRPLAYTTVMTILDRLAQKGAVTRRKKGKAYLYKPALELEDSRKSAVSQLVDFYFEGSLQKLIAYLSHLPSTRQDTNRADSPAEKPASENIPEIQDCLL
jgi:BlaI family transcriptional regulator, penicillinase repressor